MYFRVGRTLRMAKKTCKHCQRPALARGLCSTHLMRLRSGARLTAPVREHRRYTDDEVHLALEMVGALGVRATAVDLGIPRSTLQNWLHGRRRVRTRR